MVTFKMFVFALAFVSFDKTIGAQAAEPVVSSCNNPPFVGWSSNNPPFGWCSDCQTGFVSLGISYAGCAAPRFWKHCCGQPALAENSGVAVPNGAIQIQYQVIIKLVAPQGSYTVRLAAQSTNNKDFFLRFIDTGGLNFVSANGQQLLPAEATLGNCPGVTTQGVFNGVKKCLWDIDAVVGTGPGTLPAGNNGLRIEVDIGWGQFGRYTGYFLVGAIMRSSGPVQISLVNAQTFGMNPVCSPLGGPCSDGIHACCSGSCTSFICQNANGG